MLLNFSCQYFWQNPAKSGWHILKLVALDRKIAEQNTELKVIKVDLTWIKWILGISASLIIVLLSVIITTSFKILGA